MHLMRVSVMDAICWERGFVCAIFKEGLATP